jgi:hypothetical protein
MVEEEACSCCDLRGDVLEAISARVSAEREREGGGRERERQRGRDREKDQI